MYARIRIDIQKHNREHLKARVSEGFEPNKTHSHLER